jgi:hypothetical protein
MGPESARDQCAKERCKGCSNCLSTADKPENLQHALRYFSTQGLEEELARRKQAEVDRRLEVLKKVERLKQEAADLLATLQ